jgi:hypothetical protein
MEIEDQILELAVKKLAGEANVEELQQLDDLLKKNPDALTILQLMFEEWEIEEEQASEEDSHRLFAKIITSIKSTESNQIPQTAVSNYKQKPNEN